MSTINTNVAAIKARSNLDRVQREMDTSIARLSSGKRITRAHDDAAGMAITGRMESQIRGLNINIRAAKDGQSLVDTQEGAMQEITSVLQRIRELAVQAKNGTVTETDRDYLQIEVNQLIDEVNLVADQTRFNDVRILTGATFSFFTDIDVAGTGITTFSADVTAAALSILKTTVSIGSGTHLSAGSIGNVVSLVDSAIGSIASFRANLGAISNRFDHIIDNLTNVVANTEGAKSRIEDADFAVETTQLTRNTVLQQAATSMVAQANSSKNSILALIQG